MQLTMSLAYLLLIELIRVGDQISALTGCLASLLPSAYFCFRMYRQANNNDATNWLGHAYRSDIGKWIFGGLIFALAFSSGYPWNPIVLFVGYLLVQMSGIFVPIIYKGN